VSGRGFGGSRRPTPASEAGHEEAYRLVGIEPVRTPDGCTGRDWLLYKISQGDNLITGYRQGDLRAATAEVEKIVIALNERRGGAKGRPGPKPKPAAGAAAPAVVPDADDGVS
jgi:hypothetical protein